MKPLPTLSPAGWIDNPIDAVDFLLSYYYSSDKHRSLLYNKSVTNLQYTVEETVHDHNAMTIRVNNDLINLLRRYFDSVDVNVDNDAMARELAGADDSIVTLRISIKIIDNNNTYDAIRGLELKNGKFKRIIKNLHEGV